MRCGGEGGGASEVLSFPRDILRAAGSFARLASREVRWEVRAPRIQSGDGHGREGQDWGKETSEEVAQGSW